MRMDTVKSTGRLFLIPTPLGTGLQAEGYLACLPDDVRALTCFVVENAKTARQVLRRVGLATALQALDLRELNEHTLESDIDALLEPLMAGNDVGLLSEAGCPAIADPGAALVRRAHAQGVRVVPLVGPSSILLALMASGLEGQRFAFRGYVPQRSPEREAAIRALEERARDRRETQIFIEAPYRNDRLLDALLSTCVAETLLCLATDVTLATEWIRTRTIGQWRKHERPALDGRPTTFLLLALSESRREKQRGPTPRPSPRRSGARGARAGSRDACSPRSLRPG
jgi:16S rRNA (cytidine1402-2'-O)-methyltransferase